MGRRGSVWSGVGNVVLGCVARYRNQEGRRGGNRMTKLIGSVQYSHLANRREARHLMRTAVSVRTSRSSGGTARTKASRVVMGTNSSPGILGRTAVAAS